jgi:hypothetical protein
MLITPKKRGRPRKYDTPEAKAKQDVVAIGNDRQRGRKGKRYKGEKKRVRKVEKRGGKRERKANFKTYSSAAAEKGWKIVFKAVR